MERFLNHQKIKKMIMAINIPRIRQFLIWKKCKVKMKNKFFYKDAIKLTILSSYCITGISPEFLTLKRKERTKRKRFHEVSDFVHGLVADLDAYTCFYCI